MNRWTISGVCLLTITTGLVYAGCSDENAAPSATQDGGSPDAVTQSIGPEGGFIDAGDLFVAIPPGALDTTVMIGVKRTPSAAADGALSDLFELSPDGQVFRGLVTVGVRVSDETTADPGVVLSRRVAGGWERLSTRVMAGWAIASTPHFSTYATRPASPPNPACGYSRGPIPLYVPGNVETVNATKIDERTLYGGVFGGGKVELSTLFKTDQRYVTLRGIAGLPAGNGALYNITKQTITPLVIDGSGRFSVDLDVLSDGPWYGLADVCEGATQPNGAAWRWVQVECTEKCQLVPDAGPSDAGADAGALTCPFPKTIPGLAVSSWHEAYLHYRPGDYCDLQTDVKPGTIIQFRIFATSRTAGAIPGAYRWDIHTMSHGNLQGGTWLNLPDATDITMDISPAGNAVATHRVVYRFDGTDVTIKSLDKI